MNGVVFCHAAGLGAGTYKNPHRPGSATSPDRVAPTGDNTMNASLPESIRKALETVSLDDNPQGGLLHKYAVGGFAAHSGFGVELVCQGGV